jgi:prepilin-type processing-associated H-X9-DG protein
MMLSPAWTGGGTDYGGCAGSHAAFSLDTGYNLCDATMHYEPDFRPVDPATGKKVDDSAKKRCGIFGRVNVGTKFAEVTDGLSNTIMVGELQRITDITPGSKDGWSVGGPATLFTTGAMVSRSGSTLTFVDSPTSGKLMNNGFFGSPGSEHANGANYGMGDGSVRFISSSIDPNVFALLGSMADGADLSGGLD